jgi:plastocyanin
MRRIPFLLLVCLVAALGVAGCGGDDNSSSDTSATTTETTDTTTTAEGTTGASGGAGGVIKVEADPGGDLAFVQKSLTGKAGKNTIEFTNDSSLPHDVKIEEKGKEIGGTDVVTGGTAKATVQLDAGEPYVFFCSVPGHRQAGMEGKLTVK